MAKDYRQSDEKLCYDVKLLRFRVGGDRFRVAEDSEHRDYQSPWRESQGADDSEHCDAQIACR